MLVQRVKKKVLVTIDKIDTQLLKLEGNMRWVLNWLDVLDVPSILREARVPRWSCLQPRAPVFICPPLVSARTFR